MKPPEPYKTRYERGIEAIKQIIDENNMFSLDKIGRVIDEVDHTEPDHETEIKARMVEIGIPEFETGDTIDEGCVGCAGPCKVVDVSANLQKELDSAMVKLTDSRNHCGYLSKIIDDFKTIETRETDRLHKIIDDHKETIHIDRTNRAAEKELINRKYREDLRKKNATIEELKDQNIKDLKELYGIYERELDRFKHIISERDITIDGLEAELSARKEDSAVLMKVVDAIRAMTEDARTCPQIEHLSIIVRDYLNAPEVSPETPIDDGQDIAIVFTYGEIL